MASSASHKPRRKAKTNGLDMDTYNIDNRPRAEAPSKAPLFPLAAFLWPLRTAYSQWAVLPLILLAAGLFRWAAGLWGYSGFQKPPIFGDYEAQRHWMEITTHLPISQWYFHDLEWWGLDYPPLTAYHSWLLGKAGALIDASWFDLFTSRGSDDARLKVFMRASVIVSEYLTYVPAVIVFVRRFTRLNRVSTWSANIALVAILMQPATILIDHVHFQYNTVMLGLVLASMSSLLAERYNWAALLFVGALAFKQMALYYAFSIFAYLVGRCIIPEIRLGRLCGIALTTLASFAILVLPIVVGALYDAHRGLVSRPELEGAPSPPLPIFTFLSDHLDVNAMYYPVVEQLVQLVHRVFPFSRGLFEDKVANFWCAANLVIKLRRYSPQVLQKASLVFTLLAITPPNLILLVKPLKATMPLAFAATAWGFFLFSYQVHEKSVLLPLMPMTMLLAGKQGLNGTVRSWVGFANILGAWTMFPLLQRVDLGVPYAVLTLLWAYLLALPPVSWAAPLQDTQTNPLMRYATLTLHSGFYVLMLAWHIAQAVIVPPPGKPDLWIVVNVAIGAVGFMICYAWCLWRLVVESDLLPSPAKTTKTKKTQ